MSVDKEKLAKMMGEDKHIRPQPMRIPIVSLNGEKGVFKRLDVDAEGKYEAKNKDIGQLFEGVIIGIRLQLSEYTKQYKRSSNEYDSPMERVRVWEASTKKGSKMSQVVEGTPKEIREKKDYAGMRAIRWLYMVTQKGEVIKFRVRGSGLTGFFEYLKELGNSKTHTFEVLTRIQPNQQHNESLDKDYYAPHFEVARVLKEAEIEKIAPKMEAFHENLAALKATYAAAAPVEESEEPVPQDPIIDLGEEHKEDEVPVIDLEEGGF